MSYLYIAIAILAGAIFALQPPINGSLARNINSPVLAALISFSVGTILLVIINLAIGIKLPTINNLQSIPWYLWFAGGTIGAFFVTTAIFLQPKIGAVGWVACYIFGQLIMSMAIDNYGWFDLEVRSLDPLRLLGIVCLTIGAILITV